MFQYMRILSELPISMFINCFSDSENPDCCYSQNNLLLYLVMFSVQLVSQPLCLIYVWAPHPCCRCIRSPPSCLFSLKTDTGGRQKARQGRWSWKLLECFCLQFFTLQETTCGWMNHLPLVPFVGRFRATSLFKLLVLILLPH